MRMKHVILPFLLLSFLTTISVQISPLVADPMLGEYSTRALSKKEKRKKYRKAMKRRVKRGGMKRLPASQSAVRSKRKANRSAFTLTGRAVSGEPPLLLDIPNDPANTFWQPGHVDAIANGTASPDQCNSFWAGNNDGESGGFGACNMAEGLGRALELAADGGTSLCYMKSFPSEANLQAGGITVVSGTLPDDDITKIFAPGDSPRIVQVDISSFPTSGEEEEGEQDHSIFIQISPKSDTFFYKAELWFCDGTGEGAQVTGTDIIEIAKSGRITTRNENIESEGTFYSEFQGFLRPARGGVLQYDKDRPRTVEAGYLSQQDSFKVEMTLRGGQVELKSRSGSGEFPFMNASLMRFSGNSPEEVRFRDGAFRSIFNGDDGLSGVTEWRDTYYAAAPGSSLIEKIQSEEEMNNDPFFQSGPETNFDFSPYSCGVAPDIHVALNFSNQTLSASVSDCQLEAFRNLDFCFGNNEINTAQQEYGNSCFGGF